MPSLIILGRQPALGLAELESLYGAAKLRPLANSVAFLELEPTDIAFNRLGGAIKLAEVLTTIDTIDWRDIETHLLKTLPELSAQVPTGKLTIGLSSSGYKVTPGQLNALGLSLKKAIRKRHGDRPVRLVPNKELELNSAQVYHNNLAGERGWELLIVRDNERTIIARTTAVQDIDAYTVRDRDRPKRDARVGMLPPKLAQTIINLAAGSINDSAFTIHETTLLDPFCGTGVLLQEALLMGYNVEGSDLEQRMIDYTYANLTWLRDTFGVDKPTALLNPGDATTTVWAGDIGLVASETYLGKPFTSAPNPAVLAATVADCNLIIQKFLKNIHPQLKPGTRLCLAVPAWQVRPNQFKHLPVVDSLEKMGYNRMSFEHVRDEQLLYYREDQIVARQLLVLTRK